MVINRIVAAVDVVDPRGYRIVFLALLWILLWIFSGCRNADETTGPNIIVILADDLGYGDLGCYGNAYNATPEIDRLAEQGIRFTDFHSNGAVCSPTRAALVTGRYQQKSGIEGVVHAKKYRHTGLNRDAYTIADYLKERGYATGIIGKWHLGYDTAYSPVGFGFDYFKGYVSGNIDYHSHIDGAGYHDWYLKKSPLREKGYSTDLITSAAVDFIRTHQASPFFLYIAHEAPHFPFQDRDDPPFRVEGSEAPGQGDTTGVRETYKQMILAMDEGIGELIRTLEDLELSKSTLVLFLSDNGAMSVGSNYPLRGYKGSLWEGGHRVPAIAYWEGTIQPGIRHDLIMTMDIFPTIAALVSAGDTVKMDVDGIDFSPLLLSTEKEGNDRTVFWRYRQSRAVRQGSWKLLIEPDSVYLFDLDRDVGEETNLLNSEKAITDRLLREMELWEEEMDNYDIRTR